MKEYLKKSAEAVGIILDDNQLEKFKIYFDLLIETNKSLNLTAITEMKEVVLKHFIDSIFISKYYDLSNKRIIDVGTGAGFPGIPLAILFTNAEFVLMDSLNKRLNFINKVLEQAKIKNVKTVHGRAEDLGHDIQYREKFDYCLSRAVASLPVLLEFCIPFVKINGKFISYKSEMITEELKLAENAIKKLRCDLDEQHTYNLPDSDIFRVLAAFNKTGKLEKKYPRQAGKPKRNPL